MLRLALVPVVMFIFTACSGSADSPAPDGTLDLRVEVPKDEGGYLNFEGGEGTIPSGEERMFCTHMRYDGDELAFSDAQAIQAGKFGHHAILLGVKEAYVQAPGTVVDCTAASEMSKYDAFALPVEMPEGYGVLLPKGKNMVLQSHYVNTGKVPILIRDYVRLKTLPTSEVKTWAGMFATNTLLLKIGAKKTDTVSFDCTMKHDGDLVLLGGHMHETGTKIELLHGPDADHLASVYLADPWKPEFRDTPPINILWTKPIPVKAGDVFRTTCTWTNPEDKELTFPREMCSSFGYVRGTQATEVCNVGAE